MDGDSGKVGERALKWRKSGGEASQDAMREAVVTEGTQSKGWKEEGLGGMHATRRRVRVKGTDRTRKEADD